MEQDTVEYECRSCKKQIAEKDMVCPHCGNDLRKIGRDALEIRVAECIRVSESLIGIRQKEKEIPGYVVDAKYKEKTSGKTKRLVKEQLVYDRRNSTKTVKIHHVEEWDGKQWVVVHDERKEWKAKRREKTGKRQEQ